MHRTTIKADDIAETAMQLGHLTGACALVQPVDVLRDDRAEMTRALERGDAAMPVVWFGAIEPCPPNVAASPIPLPRNALVKN